MTYTLTKKNVMDLLKISLSSLNKYMKYKNLPYKKLGKAKSSKVVFDEVELLKWWENELQH